MLDTIRIRSPYVSEATANQVEQRLVKRLAIEVSTGALLWDITSGSLAGSYDSRVSVQVNRKEFLTYPARFPGEKPVTTLVDCPPYIVVEASVHKAMLGHNVTGGPLSFLPAVTWFVDHLAKLLATELPHVTTWLVERVDWAECYLLFPSAIADYINTLNSARYPRRKVHRYASESIFAPGTTTSVKVYHKGPEYAKHDRKRVELTFGPTRAIELYDLACAIMRVETSIKSKKLRAEYGDKPNVGQVTDTFLSSVHDVEVSRLLREGEHEMETVRTHTEVKRRLDDTYSPAVSRTLFGIWSQLAILGEGEVRSGLTRTSFYRYRKQLTDAGCTWFGTDIIIRKTTIPAGFSLTRQDPRRIVEEDPRVIELLQPYRVA